MTEPWVTENKGKGLWAFEKQQPKYGYRNNPRWVNPAGTGVETLSPVWPMTEGKMSAGESDKHEPCGYWYGDSGGGGGSYSPDGGGSCQSCVQIGFTTQQMSVNEQQTFTCLDINGVPVNTSNGSWVVVSGGGTITKEGVYTAPATNPNCDKNATIGLLCRGVVCATLQIAINAYTSSSIAFGTISCQIVITGYPEGTGGTISAIATRKIYDCSGAERILIVGNPCQTEVQCGGQNYSCGGPNCPSDHFEPSCSVAIAQCEAQCPSGDKRTSQMIAAGCCPSQLL